MIAIICIIIQTIVIVGGFSYYLHLRSVRRIDDPTYTVTIRATSFNPTPPPDFTQKPYDYEVEEQFHQIIDRNYPHQ